MLKTLSIRNAKRQAKDYLIYLITIIISVSLLYAFNTLVFSSEIKTLSTMLDTLSYIIVAASIAIVLIIGWLVYYMTGFMLKKRSRELGTYMLMGIETKDVTRMYFLENTLIGVLALIIGIFAGSLISQVIKAIIMNAFHLPYRFGLEFSVNTLLLTVIYWCLIFFFALIKIRKRIRRMKIYDLIYFNNQNENQIITTKKSRTRLFILSIICGIGGLYCFNHLSMAYMNSSSYGLFGVVLTLIFLFSFYLSLTSFITEFFTKRKERKYKKNHLFLFRAYTSKASTMSIMIATLALLFTATMSTLGFGVQMDQILNYEATEYNVFDIFISHGIGPFDFEEYESYMQENLPDTNRLAYTLYTGTSAEFREIFSGTAGTYLYEIDGDLGGDLYMRRSDYLKLRSMLNYAPAEIPDNSFYIHCVADGQPIIESHLTPETVIDFAGTPLNYAGISSELFNQETWNGNGSLFIIILPDAITEQLSGAYSLYAVMGDGITLAHIDDLEDISNQLSQIINQEYGGGDTVYYGDYIMARVRSQENASVIYVMVVIPLFYVAFILMITSITILSTQQLSDAPKYQNQYRILKNLGMSQKQLSKTANQHLLIYFLTPLLPPLLFSSVIIRSFSMSISGGHIATPENILTCYLASLGLFLLIYTLYYLASATSFKRTVLEHI